MNKKQKISKTKDIKLLKKNLKASFSAKIKNIIKYIMGIDIDWIFIGLFTFLILDINIWHRILGSIGASYIYKMILKSIIRLIIMRK